MPPAPNTPSRLTQPVDSGDQTRRPDPGASGNPDLSNPNLSNPGLNEDLDRLDLMLASLKSQLDTTEPQRVGDIGKVGDIGSGAHAEHASRLAELGSLSSLFAHEVNNLMTQVGGRAQLALLSPDRQDRTQCALELAYKASNQIARLAEYFMGAQMADSVPLVPFVDAHQQALAYLPTDCVTRFGFELDAPAAIGSLPAIDCPMLEHVLLNCYRNAARAMLDQPNSIGSVTIRACLVEPASETTNCSTWNNSHAEAPAVLIEIRDAGVGMSSSQIDQLLGSPQNHEAWAKDTDPNQGWLFEETAGTEEADLFEQHGIGLQVCRQIVGRANGRLAIRSQLGVGTTVCIWLPIAA